MKRLSVAGFIVVILVLIAAACSPSGIEPVAEIVQPTPVVTVNNSNANAEEIQTIQLDNCDGKGDSKRTEVRSQSIEAEISAGLAAQIGSNVGVVQGAVQVAVGTALTAGSERSSSIELSAPPGTHMEIQLVWTGEEQVGVVQNILGSDVPIAFRTFAPTDVRIKSQYDIGCPGGRTSDSSQFVTPQGATLAADSILTTITEEPQTIVEVTAETSLPTPRPPFSIGESDLAPLNYGEVPITDVEACLSSVHAGPRPFKSFGLGDELPSNVLIASNLGYNGDQWTSFPVIPVCHNGGWGLFRSIDAFTSPYEGAYWIIVP